METLSFDGKGINGPDKYKSRLATFTNDEAAKKYGNLFAAAPELLEALRNMMTSLEDTINGYPERELHESYATTLTRVRQAIAKATGV